jgi:hypothetical protein
VTERKSQIAISLLACVVQFLTILTLVSSPLYAHFTGGKHLCKTSFVELGLPLPEPVGSLSPMVTVVVAMCVITVVNLVVGSYNAFNSTKKRPAFICLKGLMPVVMCIVDFWLVF